MVKIVGVLRNEIDKVEMSLYFGLRCVLYKDIEEYAVDSYTILVIRFILICKSDFK